MEEPDRQAPSASRPSFAAKSLADRSESPPPADSPDEDRSACFLAVVQCLIGFILGLLILDGGAGRHAEKAILAGCIHWIGGLLLFRLVSRRRFRQYMACGYVPTLVAVLWVAGMMEEAGLIKKRPFMRSRPRNNPQQPADIDGAVREPAAQGNYD